MESSRRYLLRDIAGNMSISKNNQNTYHTVIYSHPKQLRSNTGVSFLLCTVSEVR